VVGTKLHLFLLNIKVIETFRKFSIRKRLLEIQQPLDKIIGMKEKIPVRHEFKRLELLCGTSMSNFVY
jgi:hypothetical protein